MDPYHQESPAPPILQGDFVVPPTPPSWPRVLGVISIIFGALGGLVNIWSTVAPLFIDAMASMVPSDPTSQASFKAQKDYAPYTMLVSGLCVIGSILLLVGGIGLCTRARWAIKVCRIWIPWRIITAVLSAAVGYIVMQAATKAMGTQPNAAPFAGMGQAMGTFFVFLGLAWGCALPVFMLIWFSRPQVRLELQNWA